MKKIGFLGLGVMGLSMALNVSKKIGVEVIGYDVSEHSFTVIGKWAELLPPVLKNSTAPVMFCSRCYRLMPLFSTL